MSGLQRRGPFYLITPDDFRMLAECYQAMCEICTKLQNNDITFVIVKYEWPNHEHFDLRPVQAGVDWKSQWEHAEELGTYDVYGHLGANDFFEYAIEEGWV